VLRERDYIRSLPFTIYDFFGYLIPGLISLLIPLIYDIILLFIHPNTLRNEFHTPIYKLISISIPSNINNWVFSIFLIFVILIVCYISGHLIATVSGLMVDKYLIKTGIEYPFINLLGFPYEEKDQLLKRYRKALFLYLHGMIFLLLIVLFSEKNFWVLFFFIIIIIIIFFGLFVKEIYLYLNKNNSTKNKLLRFSKKCLEIYYVPYNRLVSSTSKQYGLHYKFNRQFIQLYKENFENIFNLDPVKAGTNNYWLCYCYLIDKKPYIERLIRNWLNLYSFARNLSFAFYLGLIYCIISLFLNIKVIEQKYLLLFFSMILLIIGVILLVRYYYIYYTYYSKFIFRAFVYTSNEELKKKN